MRLLIFAHAGKLCPSTTAFSGQERLCGPERDPNPRDEKITSRPMQAPRRIALDAGKIERFQSWWRASCLASLRWWKKIARGITRGVVL